MDLKKHNIIIFCMIILSIVIVFFIIKSNRSKEMYTIELNGKVEAIRYVGRGEGYVEVKFTGEEKFNPLCVIYIGSKNKNDLRVGDSIHKRKESTEYHIYRQDEPGKYIFYKTLKSIP